MNKYLEKVSTYLILGIAVLAIFYNILGNRLFQLNQVQFDTSGDGFKNYFTFSYQYLYGKGIWFDGMLYPFGDLAIYADAQIGIVWIFQILKIVGVQLDNYLIGLINILPLVSFLVGGILILKIFEHYKIDRLWSLVFTIFCLSLSPQLIRIQSHFALSYPIFIPAIWLFYLKYKEIKRINIFSTLAILLITYSAFIHPYHLLILSIFSILYWLSNISINRKFEILPIIIGLIPLLIFYISTKYLDIYDDRPENPFGIFAHNTIWSDLLPYYGFIRDWVEDPVIYRHYFSEGYCYTGGLVFLVPIFLLVKRWFSKLFEARQYEFGKQYLFISLSALFIGAALHVLLTNGYILEILTPLKQFRGMGRVSWIFYYIFFIYLAFIFYHLLKSCQSLLLKYVMVVACIALWVYESNEYHKTIKDNLNEFSAVNHFDSRYIISDLLDEKGLEPKRFQAVLTLPISTEGVEKIDIKDDWHTKMYAMEYAYQTGTPLTSCVMSRSPVSKVLSILSLGNFSKKYIEESSFTEKPLLIILENLRIESYSDILQKAKFINNDDNVSLYQIELNDLLSYVQVDSAVESTPSNNTCPFFFYDFDNNQNAGLHDQGSFYHETGSTLIFEENFEQCSEDSIQVYSLSLWYQILPSKSTIPAFEIIQENLDGKVLLKKSFRDLHFTRVEVVQNWLRLKLKVNLLSQESMIKLYVNGEHIFIDKILLIEDGGNFTKIINDEYVYTNHNVLAR